MASVSTTHLARGITVSTPAHLEEANVVNNLRPDVLEDLLNLADDLSNVQLQPYSDQLISGSYGIVENKSMGYGCSTTLLYVIYVDQVR